MKKLNMNKTTRQNYLTYGLVIVAFVIILHDEHAGTRGVL